MWMPEYHTAGAASRLSDAVAGYGLRGFTHYVDADDDGSWFFSTDGQAFLQTAADLKQIVDIQLQRLRQRLEERHINLELTDEAKTHLVRTGYDPHYGARPLKRAIQKEIETSLARQILQGRIRDGQTVLVDYDPARGELTFAPQGTAAPEPAGVG